MFKPETIAKVRRQLVDAVESARRDVESLRVSISAGNRKIGRVMNVSMAPMVTCGAACAHCAPYCYDVKACCQYSNTVIGARARNTAMALYNRDAYFQQIDAAMNRRRRNKYFRWHVAGDIIDADYFRRMVENARRHPDFIIWTYTKQYHLVNAYIAEFGPLPANFTVMFSEWRGLPMDNPTGAPEFRVIFKGEATPADATWICPGNCDVCKACHRGCIAGETTYAHEH